MRSGFNQARRRGTLNGSRSNKVGPFGCAPSMVRSRSLVTTPPGAGHDDGKMILSERLTDVARQTAIAQPLGDFAI
jgi:hypothetical protein